MENYTTTFTIKRLWIVLTVSVVLMFGTLLFLGREIYQVAPPIPLSVQTTAGSTVYTRDDIQRGQNIWQSTGGMQQGSIWGHGGYVAPDWSADWLQREATALLARITEETKLPDQSEAIAKQTRLAMLRQEMRENTYDPDSEVITVTPRRADAMATVAEHYSNLFMGVGEEYLALR